MKTFCHGMFARLFCGICALEILSNMVYPRSIWGISLVKEGESLRLSAPRFLLVSLSLQPTKV